GRGGGEGGAGLGDRGRLHDDGLPRRRRVDGQGPEPDPQSGQPGAGTGSVSPRAGQQGRPDVEGPPLHLRGHRRHLLPARSLTSPQGKLELCSSAVRNSTGIAFPSDPAKVTRAIWEKVAAWSTSVLGSSSSSSR